MEMSHRISLKDLIAGIDVSRIDGDRDIDITGVVNDSRLIGPGHLFFALDGDRVDGRHFIEEAHRGGASAVIGEAPLQVPPGCTGVTILDARAVIGTVASRFFDHPSDRLVTIGVTGTNGKTTITYLLESILRSAGMSPGVVGTINYRFGGRTLKAVNTTPEAPELQRILDEMAEDGTTHAVMEISSHGLALGGCRFNVGVFTNLSQDHLDFHKTMESYLEAKSRLFTSLLFPGQGMDEPIAVINIDDPAGARLAGMTVARVIGYGID
ncbi:Mur ligase family protein, partial [Thermodesulfobacteriota bacterium]